jgi:XTP/dITP diphosphohydrolase
MTHVLAEVVKNIKNAVGNKDMKQLLIATRNINKTKEIGKIFLDLDLENFEIINLDDIEFDKNFDVEETGTTFQENAILKAKGFGEKVDLITLADDSGLEVDALDGRPGVYSARYAATREARNQKLLRELENIEEKDRTARYRVVMALYNPKDKTIKTFDGKCEGVILDQPKGESGFGYDPLFYYPKFKKTLAEVDIQEKNKVSHRRKALEKVAEFLIENSCKK